MEEAGSIGGRLLIVFDGECGFCNRSIRWLLRQDRRDRLRFVPFQSVTAGGLLARNGIEALEADGGSILVVRGFDETTESVLTRSDAVLTALKELPQPWPAVAGAMRNIPKAIRDWGYGVVARWRHQISGRLERCPLPTAEERRRFL
jgi:predicted DCC family thiol-disulfide oxidoreductase YuxK